MNALPIELLQQICTTLCPHCTYINSDDHFSSRFALSSLSRTNQLLRAIAQPILFHRLKIRTKSSCAFLRMLYESPHLASNVKQLAPLRDELFFDGSKEDTQILKRAARGLLLDVDGDPEFEKWYGDLGHKHFLTELAIALLPNLEACVTEIEYDISDEELVPVNRFLGSRFKRLGSSKQQPGGLPNIRALGFAKQDDWGFSLATPGIAVLLSATPNLERLVCDGAHGFGTLYPEWIGNVEIMAPGLQNLKVLSITDSALANSEDDFEFRQLRRFIQLCAKLETFRFNSVGAFLGEIDGGHLPPARFIEALESVKEKLKVLDLDLTESTPPSSLEEWALTSQSFASFQRLESLRLDERSFCLHYVDAFYNLHKGGLATEPTCLTNILPKTVRFLTVILVGEGYAWLDIARVAFVAEKDFPWLEAVTVERRDHQGLHRSGRPRMAQEAFEHSRVRYSLTDWDRYDGVTQFDDVYSYSLVGSRRPV